MADFSYITVSGKRLKDFLAKIQVLGVPTTEVKPTWLATIGFKGGNEYTLLRILKFIGFIDASDKPTSRWTAYKNKTEAPKILAQAIHESYSELFELYPKAHKASDTNLMDFFSDTGKADPTVKKMVLTFKTLCELADFEAAKKEPPPKQPEPTPAREALEQKSKTIYHGLGEGVTININIQLTLPETKDPEVYRSFFQALKNNLLDTESKKKND